LVVSASLVLWLEHSNGQDTDYFASLWNTSAACDPIQNNYAAGGLGTAQPSDNYYPDLSLVQSFPIGVAGNYSIALIAKAAKSSVSDSTAFYFSSVVGVFYPA